MDVGTQIKKLRMASGFTQQELADHLSISRQAISNWENRGCGCFLGPLCRN